MTNSKNALSLTQQLQLIDHLKSFEAHNNKHKLDTKKVTLDAANALGFSITPQNLTFVAKAADIKLPSPTQTRRTKKPHLHNQTRLLARTLLDIIKNNEIGAKRMEALKILANYDAVYTAMENNE